MADATSICVMLVAAEASGDALGADLASRALRGRGSGTASALSVLAASAMAKEGVSSAPFDIAELSILGLLEGLMAYPQV